MEVFNLTVKLISEKSEAPFQVSTATGDFFNIGFVICLSLLFIAAAVIIGAKLKSHRLNQNQNLLHQVINNTFCKVALFVSVVTLSSLLIFITISNYHTNAFAESNEKISSNENQIIGVIKNDGEIVFNNFTINNTSDYAWNCNSISLSLNNCKSSSEALKECCFSVSNNNNLLFNASPDGVKKDPLHNFAIAKKDNGLLNFSLTNISKDEAILFENEEIFTLTIEFKNISDDKINVSLNNNDRGTLNLNKLDVLDGSSYKINNNCIIFSDQIITNDFTKKTILEAISKDDFIFNKWTIKHGEEEIDLKDGDEGVITDDTNFKAYIGYRPLKYLARTYFPIITSPQLPQGVKFYDENENEINYDGTLASLKNAKYYTGSGFYAISLVPCGWDRAFNMIGKTGTSTLRDDYREQLHLVDDEDVCVLEYNDNRESPKINVDGYEFPIQNWYDAYQPIVNGGLWTSHTYADGNYANFWDVWGKCFNGTEIVGGHGTQSMVIYRHFNDCSINTCVNDTSKGQVENLNFKSNVGSVYKVSDNDKSIIKIGDKTFFAEAKPSHTFSHWEMIIDGNVTKLSEGDNGLIFKNATFIAVFN